MKWEYMSLTINFEGRIMRQEKFSADLNKLGDEGWELVQILMTGDDYFSSHNAKVALFKRPKKN